MEARNSTSTSAPGRKFGALAQELSKGLLSFEKPGEFIITLIYVMPVLAPIRFCIAAGIFRVLAAAGEPLSADKLAAGLTDEHGGGAADDEERRDFVARMLRPLSALRLVDEVSSYVYQANDLTMELADPGMAAGFKLVYDDIMGPSSTMAHMWTYPKLNQYKSPPSAVDGPFQRARNSVGTPPFKTWAQETPEQFDNLSAFMPRVQKERLHWTEWFPAEALFKSKDTFTFVDVGAGRGHDLFALAAKYPEQKARFIMQDLPSVIDEGSEQREKDGTKIDSRVEVMKHDFFQPQSVQHADIYWMHKIMHDWPDDESVKILTRLKDAMGPQSRIFLNDMILPNERCELL